MGGKYLNVLPHSVMKKFLEFFLWLEIKISFFFFSLQYELLSRIDIQNFKVMLEVDENEVMIKKSKLDSNFFPQM